MKKQIMTFLIIALFSLTGCQPSPNYLSVSEASSEIDTQSVVSQLTSVQSVDDSTASNIASVEPSIIESSIEHSESGQTSANYLSEQSVKLDNGDLVGPLYQKYYYDIINHPIYTFAMSSDSNTLNIQADHDNYYIEFKDETNHYKLLINQEGNYLIDDDTQEATMIPNSSVSDLDNLIQQIRFSGLQYAGTSTEKINQTEYTVEKYSYKDSSDYAYFYFKDTQLAMIRDSLSSVSIDIISSTVTTNFKVPNDYKIIGKDVVLNDAG